jgi:hypothetical protein
MLRVAPRTLRAHPHSSRATVERCHGSGVDERLGWYERILQNFHAIDDGRCYGSIPTASTATAAATVAAPSTTAAAAVAAATAPRFAGLGLVDREATAVDFLVMKTLDGGLSLGLAAHFDKAKAFAPTRVAILDDLRALHDPEPGEQLLQIGVADLVGQVPDIQFPAHVNLQEQGRDPTMISRVGTNLGRLGRPIRREGERGRRGQNPNGLTSRAPSDSDQTIISILRPGGIVTSGLFTNGRSACDPRAPVWSALATLLVVGFPRVSSGDEPCLMASARENQSCVARAR